MGDYVHVYKNKQGWGCPGGILSVSPTRSVSSSSKICLSVCLSVSVCCMCLKLVQAEPSPSQNAPNWSIQRNKLVVILEVMVEV